MERSPFRVLIVDDMLLMRILLRELLSAIKTVELDIYEASNGKRALEIADQYNPQVVLLDFNMTGMDGEQVRRALRQAGHKCPIIFVTSVSRGTVGKAAMEDPGTSYIQKADGSAKDVERFDREVKFYVQIGLFPQQTSRTRPR